MKKKNLYKLLMIIFWALTFISWIIPGGILGGEFVFPILAIIFTILYIKKRQQPGKMLFQGGKNITQNNVVPFWFKHFTNGRMLKLKIKISQMHPNDIKRLFEKSLHDGLLWGISKEYERALAIYMLSDDSLKKELDDVSIELQNKKIDINETIIDTLAMVHPFTGLIAQRKKEKLIKLQEKEVKRNRENENNDPQA